MFCSNYENEGLMNSCLNYCFRNPNLILEFLSKLSTARRKRVSASLAARRQPGVLLLICPETVRRMEGENDISYTDLPSTMQSNRHSESSIPALIWFVESTLTEMSRCRIRTAGSTKTSILGIQASKCQFRATDLYPKTVEPSFIDHPGKILRAVSRRRRESAGKHVEGTWNRLPLCGRNGVRWYALRLNGLASLVSEGAYNDELFFKPAN